VIKRDTFGQTKRSSEGNWRQIQETSDKRIKTPAQSKKKKIRAIYETKTEEFW